MVRYGKAQLSDGMEDDPQQMKVYRADRKYRGHKLAVAIGHNRTARTENSTSHAMGQTIKPAQHRIKRL